MKTKKRVFLCFLVITSYSYFSPKFPKNRKFNKLVKQLDNYIIKNKKKYFFIDENMNWIINGIFREYSKLSIDNIGSVRTSLYLAINKVY